MTFPISRHDESTFPKFSSHSEAAAFFKGKFGMDFVLESSENIGGMVCYFYAVIVDHAAYHKGRKLLSKGQPITGELGMQFITSYQPVQIMDNGNVHIVY